MIISSRMAALKPLLSGLGWKDTSTDTQERLSNANGMLGLIIEPASLVIVAVDPHTNDPVNITITGGWSFGMIVNLVRHLEMIESLRVR